MDFSEKPFPKDPFFQTRTEVFDLSRPWLHVFIRFFCIHWHLRFILPILILSKTSQVFGHQSRLESTKDLRWCIEVGQILANYTKHRLNLSYGWHMSARGGLAVSRLSGRRFTLERARKSLSNASLILLHLWFFSAARQVESTLSIHIIHSTIMGESFTQWAFHSRKKHIHFNHANTINSGQDFLEELQALRFRRLTWSRLTWSILSSRTKTYKHQQTAGEKLVLSGDIFGWKFRPWKLTS